MLDRFFFSLAKGAQSIGLATHWTGCYRMTRFHTGMVGTIELTPTRSAARRRN